MLLSDSSAGLVPPSDSVEQQAQVQHLVALAQKSLQLHRQVVGALQALLLLFLLVKASPSPFAKMLSASLLSLSILRALVIINASPYLPPVEFNLALAAPLVFYTVYLWSSSTGARSEEAFLSGCVPLGAILLRVATEWEGERAVTEAKGLADLMYDSPEA
ncbi:hypothetical protein JCM11491_000986 [Sporobolomyces phaffii]